MPDINLMTETVKDIFDSSDTRAVTAFGTTTIVATKLPSGFVIVESYSVPDPDEYDIDVGIQECTARIMERIWSYEMYQTMSKAAHNTEEGVQ